MVTNLILKSIEMEERQIKMRDIKKLTGDLVCKESIEPVARIYERSHHAHHGTSKQRFRNNRGVMGEKLQIKEGLNVVKNLKSPSSNSLKSTKIKSVQTDACQERSITGEIIEILQHSNGAPVLSEELQLKADYECPEIISENKFEACKNISRGNEIVPTFSLDEEKLTESKDVVKNITNNSTSNDTRETYQQIISGKPSSEELDRSAIRKGSVRFSPPNDTDLHNYQSQQEAATSNERPLSTSGHTRAANQHEDSPVFSGERAQSHSRNGHRHSTLLENPEDVYRSQPTTGNRHHESESPTFRSTGSSSMRPRHSYRRNQSPHQWPEDSDGMSEYSDSYYDDPYDGYSGYYSRHSHRKSPFHRSRRSEGSKFRFSRSARMSRTFERSWDMDPYDFRLVSQLLSARPATVQPPPLEVIHLIHVYENCQPSTQICTCTNLCCNPRVIAIPNSTTAPAYNGYATEGCYQCQSKGTSEIIKVIRV